ncbi:hypothetical protein J6590_032870 [Homalodisca vitripennis]|nr:hypothetical protein J6590_032870 [Homalodisca vitripennis]
MTNVNYLGSMGDRAAMKALPQSTNGHNYPITESNQQPKVKARPSGSRHHATSPPTLLHIRTFLVNNGTICSRLFVAPKYRATNIIAITSKTMFSRSQCIVWCTDTRLSQNFEFLLMSLKKAMISSMDRPSTCSGDNEQSSCKSCPRSNSL